MHAIVARLRRASLGALMLLAALPLAMPAVPADAATLPVTGYVWANDSTSAHYTPQHQFNGSSWLPAFAATAGHNSQGVYTVTFPGMAVAGGIAHATAFGSGTQQCKVKNWGPVAPGSPDLRVLVRCFNLNGTPADSMFMASFTAQSGILPNAMAYLLADQPTAASYTASSPYSFNSKGVLNTITRTGVGAYTARLGGVGASGGHGHVQVTAYGDGSERCTVAQWVPMSVGFGVVHEDVSVRCFSVSGAPADSMFTLTYVDRVSLDGVATDLYGGGYLWAEQPSTASYVPNLLYQWSSKGLVNSVQRVGTGRYAVNFPGQDPRSGAVQVTAYGTTSSAFCKVVDMATISRIGVQCFDTHGTPLDSQFDVTQFTPGWLL